MEALQLIAALLTQEGLLLGRLHALGGHRQAQRVAELDDGDGDGFVLGVAGDVADEAAVDLQALDGETFG